MSADEPGSAVDVDWLVCFAVKEEAAFFQPTISVAGDPGVRFVGIVTGVGRRNASTALGEALTKYRPERVLTTGFAGGLNPALKHGALIYDQDFDFGMRHELEALGAVHANFHCSVRVAVSVGEKADLWRTTGADAVEMESSVIRTLCRAAGVPSATLRVVLDAADRDLPMDFNVVMSPGGRRVNWFRFAKTLVSRPLLLGRMMTFHEETLRAAKILGGALNGLLERKPTAS